MTVSRQVLTSDKDSFLTKMFNSGDEIKPLMVDDEKEKDKKRVFIDRNGHSFQQMINYLQNFKSILPEFESIPERKGFFEEL